MWVYSKKQDSFIIIHIYIIYSPGCMKNLSTDVKQHSINPSIYGRDIIRTISGINLKINDVFGFYKRIGSSNRIF